MKFSNSIALIVNVNEDIICSDAEEFQLSVMVTKENYVIASTVLPFSDSIAYFENILQGEYNCTTSVVRGRTHLETTTFNCTSCKL